MFVHPNFPQPAGSQHSQKIGWPDSLIPKLEVTFGSVSVLFMNMWGFFSKRGWLWPLSVCLDVTSPDVFDLSGRNSLDYWDASCAPTKSQRNCDSASHASFTMLIYSHLEKIHQRVKGVLISRVPPQDQKRRFLSGNSLWKGKLPI